MNSSHLPQRIAVCSWSLLATDPQDLAAKLKSTGIDRVQLALDPLRETPAVWGETQAVLRQAGITIISGMFGCVGEDYSTLDSIRVTGGIAPDATWDQNLANIGATVAIASALGLKLVTFHAGFVPHDPADPDFAKMVSRLGAVADLFAAADMTVALETGQETAAGLAELLVALNRSNVAVNFDPANMLLYGKGEPVAAVRLLGRWIRQVHIKDAVQTTTPGSWGAEVAAGTGEVDWTGFFAALAEVNFTGDLVIEREAGDQRITDIRTAHELVLKSGGKPVNVAVVGLGFMGVTHLRAYLANPMARVVAVCDHVRVPVNGVLAGVSGNITKSDDIDLGTEVKVYRTPEELLANTDVELVDICTPTPLHAAQVIAALKAGKHVICEKPLARTSAEARAILEIAETSPGMLMPAMCMRFWPGWSWLKQAVAEQTYGKVLAARFRRDSAMPGWSQGTYSQDLGGALFDLHIHDSDFVNHLFGKPAGVFSTGVLAESGSINHVVTQYDYPCGPSVYAEGSWLLNQGFNMSYTLLCEHATIDFDLSRGARALMVTETGKEPRVVETGAGDGYSKEIAYIVDCVAKRQAPTVVTALDGVTALEICEAEERSIRSGAPVKF